MRSTRVLMVAIVAAAAPLFLSSLPAVGQSRGITPEDYFAFKTVNDVQLSPDGSMIAFVVGTIDQKQNRRANQAAIDQYTSNANRLEGNNDEA